MLDFVDIEVKYYWKMMIQRVYNEKPYRLSLYVNYIKDKKNDWVVYDFVRGIVKGIMGISIEYIFQS